MKKRSLVPIADCKQPELTSYQNHLLREEEGRGKAQESVFLKTSLGDSDMPPGFTHNHWAEHSSSHILKCRQYLDNMCFFFATIQK